MPDRKRPAGRWMAALGLAAAVLFVGIWWLVPPRLYHEGGTDDGRLKAITDTRTALLAGLVGVGALGTFWLNSRTYSITARTFEVTERGHLTDRYAKAIEQLGSGTLDVRLGGIYALEQIANDSQHARDQMTITEVLGAFVRVHGDPLTRLRGRSPDHGLFRGAGNQGEMRKQAARILEGVEDIAIEVQAAVTVLGRLPDRQAWARGDLSGALLCRANLSGAVLSGANLSGTYLVGATLQGANLAGVTFQGANLAGASFRNANLAGASFHGANLEGAMLHGADLTDTQGIEQRQIEQSLGSTETVLPLALEPPDTWLKPSGK